MDAFLRDLRCGLRMLLNYGHTIGHGLEAAAGYDRYLHGEAVAVGMTGAARCGSPTDGPEAVDPLTLVLESMEV